VSGSPIADKPGVGDYFRDWSGQSGVTLNWAAVAAPGPAPGIDRESDDSAVGIAVRRLTIALRMGAYPEVAGSATAAQRISPH
jgi:hypothetical protein